MFQFSPVTPLHYEAQLPNWNALMQSVGRLRNMQPNALSEPPSTATAQQPVAHAAPSAPSVAQPSTAEDFTRWITGQEGFRSRPYGDYSQTSIGYGTRARPGETSITEADALARLNDEIGNARSMVRRFNSGLSQPQENALTDLTFNSGSRWMQSGLGNAVSAGNWPEAQRLFQQYINAGGQPLDALRRRRQSAAPWLAMGY